MFICSTNLTDDLDPAALRRFDYLRPDQAWKPIRAVLKKQGVREPRKTVWLPR
jgi:hypothetical protein